MSGIDNAKKGMGWLHPNARPCCGNCKHMQFRKHESAWHPEYRCMPGGFLSTRYAICDQHTPYSADRGAAK
jgi:hypothetical protein